MTAEPDAARRPTRNPGRRSRRRSLRIYVSLLSITLMVILGVLAGRFLVPGLIEQRHLDRLMDASAAPPAATVDYFASRISHDRTAGEHFTALWRSVADNEPMFLRLGGVIVQANMMGGQPAELQVRYHRLTRMRAESVDDRVAAVDMLLVFAADPNAELERALADALADPSPRVACEAVFVLPTWLGQPWAVMQLTGALSDARPEVRRQAALAAAVVAEVITDSAIGRQAFLATRTRLIEIAADDPDPQCQAAAAWGLFRMYWMAQSALGWIEPYSSLPLRRTAPLLLSNEPIATDHTDPGRIQQALEQMVLAESDMLVRQRAALALVCMAERGGVPRPLRQEVAAALLASRDWRDIALGARLVGLTRQTAAVRLLLARAADDRPDFVSEQLAFAFGRLATRPIGYVEPAEFESLKAAGLTGLRLLLDPSAGATTQPDASAEDAPPRISPRTRLAVAVALGELGELRPLFELAERRLEPEDSQFVSPETLADMACIELARLARQQSKLAEPIGEAARRFSRDYSYRLQRSGALLIGLLGDQSERDRLARAYEGRRAAGADKLTVIYTQMGLLLLGDASANQPVPPADWLNDPEARTPGVYYALAVAGQQAALDDLLGPADDVAVVAMMDDWHLRPHIHALVRKLAEPLPAADEELADHVARMTIWWYKTQRHRLHYLPRDRQWTAQFPAP